MAIVIQNFIFEKQIPSLEDICKKVEEKYNGRITCECDSSFCDMDLKDDPGLEKMIKDTTGISEPHTIHFSRIETNDGLIALQHSEINSCVTLRYHFGDDLLFDLVVRTIQELGGKKKIDTITKEEKKRLLYGFVLSNLFVLMIIFLSLWLYIYKDFGLFKVVGIVIAIYAIKFSIKMTLVYCRAKKMKWL